MDIDSIYRILDLVTSLQAQDYGENIAHYPLFFIFLFTAGTECDMGPISFRFFSSLIQYLLLCSWWFWGPPTQFHRVPCFLGATFCSYSATDFPGHSIFSGKWCFSNWPLRKAADGRAPAPAEVRPPTIAAVDPEPFSCWSDGERRCHWVFFTLPLPCQAPSIAKNNITHTHVQYNVY